MSVSRRPLYVIARDIQADWKEPYYGAKPYIQALTKLDKVTDMYGIETGATIVLYFLVNARSWRGETAQNIKAELRVMAGIR